MSLGDIEACMNDAERALNNLDLLLSSVASKDETIANHAVEALENCGPPRRENLAIVSKYLAGANALQVYWAATLAGRHFSEANPLPIDVARDFEDRLTSRLFESPLDDPAKEKICWAIGNLPGINDASKQRLESLLEAAPPRLVRLIDKVLSKS